jgi:hypothetical protein
MPSFGVGYGAGADAHSIIKHDGNVYDRADTVTGGTPCAIAGGFFYTIREDLADLLDRPLFPIDRMVADDWSVSSIPGTYPPQGGFGIDTSLDVFNDLMVGGDVDGLTVGILQNSQTSTSEGNLLASITTAFNTGFCLQDGASASPHLIALANSATADRSGNSNTLTENGTVTEAAVETGAELMGYGGFTANTNYLSRANDTDFEPGSGVAFVGLIWLKVNGVDGGSFDRVVEYQSTSPADGWSLDINNGGSLQSSFAEGGGSVSKASSATGFDDNAWHLAAFGRTTDGRAFISVDGLPREFSSATDTDSIANASATLRIGEQVDGTNTLVNGTVALFRFAKASISDDQIRKIYEAEKRMFVANAKCLLQGASDAVLDARVDPLTGKYIVTQSDTQDIFDGLTIETERTIAAGGTTFEHGLLWGDAVAEINDANLFASTPATDQRQVNEMVRSMAAELPAGVDLSKAKAFLVLEAATTIRTSFNIVSVANPSTGVYDVLFAVPFKTKNFSVVATSGVPDGTGSTAGIPYLHEYLGTSERIGVRVNFDNDAGAKANRNFCLVAFGELENE